MLFSVIMGYFFARAYINFYIGLLTYLFLFLGVKNVSLRTEGGIFLLESIKNDTSYPQG